VRNLKTFTLLSVSILLASCAKTVTSAEQMGVTVTIDSKLSSQGLGTLGINSASKVTTLSTEQGDVPFFAKEIIVRVKNEVAFANFLKKYGGVVLQDGSIPAPPIEGKIGDAPTMPQKEWRLVRITAPNVDLSVFAKKLEKKGVRGKVRVPDQETANQYALSLEMESNADLGTEVNYAMKSTASGTATEHKSTAAGGYRNPNSDWWLNSSTGNTIKAWEQLGATGGYIGIAIIDSGFTPGDWDMTGYDPITKTGSRYVYQYDFSQNDYDVTSDSTGDMDYQGSTWHGNGAANVAFGAQNNHYGSSGVAPGAIPMLFRIGRSGSGLLSYYDAGRAVDTATAWGAKVISMSFVADTPGGAGVPNTYLGDALNRSNAAGVINVAALGNSNRYVGTTRYPWFMYPIPAIWPSVIAVGATNYDNTRSSYSNYGDAAQIWAPAGEGGFQILGGPRPNFSCYTEAARCSDVDDTVRTYNGTSAATPYVAGAIALMKQRNINLKLDQVLSILQSTSRKDTPDGNVNVRGVIDVYAAVKKARP
jgi:Subtilase family